jgi:surface polysaccharide O-acyltransferase-like enzyme
MVNGALLLRKPVCLKKHVQKVGKLIVLTLVWGLISLLLLAWILGDDYSAKEAITAYTTWRPGRINHLWFLQALASIYLILPLVKIEFDHPEKKHIHYLCWILLVFSFGPPILQNASFVSKNLFGLNFYRHLETLLGGFNPLQTPYAYTLLYFVVGGLLMERKVRLRSSKAKLYTLILFLVSLATLAAAGIWMSFLGGEIYDTVWSGYDSLMVLVMTTCIFLGASGFNLVNPVLERAVTLTGSNTMGIYVMHVFVGSALFPFYEQMPFSSSLLCNLAFAAVVLITSLLVTLAVNRVAWMRSMPKI